MTRSEEIQQKAREEAWYIADTSQTKEEAAIGGYCLGAAYADRTMLDRACDWLAKHISPEDIYDDETNEMPTTYLTVNLHDNMLDFIHDFRRAMEGGAE